MGYFILQFLPFFFACSPKEDKGDNAILNAYTAGDWYRTYKDYDHIMSKLDAFTSSPIVESILLSHPTTGFSIGSNNYAPKSLRVIKITGLETPGNAVSSRKSIVITCGIHAREWLPPMICTYFIDYFVSNYNSNPSVSNLVNNIVWHIIPVANPDGYRYTWASNLLSPYGSSNKRYWRKNRSSHSTDLNRNWGGPTWGTGSNGVAASNSYSNNRSSDIYRGDACFSENETTAIKEYAETQINNLEVFLDFHTYGGQIRWPFRHDTAQYGYNDSNSLINGNLRLRDGDNNILGQQRSFTRKNDLETIQPGLLSAIQNGSTHSALNDAYQVSKQLLNSPTGRTIDWFAWRFNAIALLIETRPTGGWSTNGYQGFHYGRPQNSNSIVINTPLIEEASKEQLGGIKYLASYILNNER